MIRKVHGFWQELVRNKYVYITQVLLALTISIDYALGINIDHTLGAWFYVLPAAAALLLCVPLFGEWELYRAKYFVLAIYTGVIGIFLTAFTPVFGPYFQILILLLFAYAYWYRWRGLAIGCIASFSILVVAATYQMGSLDTNLWLSIAVRTIILAVIGVLFVLASHRDIDSAEEITLKETVSFERTRLLSLINSMADAVIATNSKGQIVFYNGAALDLLNTNISIENKYLDSILPLFNEDDDTVNLIDEARKVDRVTKREDLHFVSNEEQPIDVYASVSPIRAGFTQNNEAGFIVVLRDITKQKTLDEERNEFISVTSHELRTPIAITEANISTALLPNVAGDLKPNVKELLEQAHHNIIFLGDLVNDLATLARAERNDLQIELKQIEPVTLMQKLVHDYTPEATTKGLTLLLDPKSQANSISNSELYVREILQNFVTNAMKYTEKGSITLHVESTADGSAVFSVIDTGIGISAQDKKKVFSKFYRAEDYRTRKTRGTGLGLYITMKLAQRTRGQIWFKSELNKGSTFFFQVPSIKPKPVEQ